MILCTLDRQPTCTFHGHVCCCPRTVLDIESGQPRGNGRNHPSFRICSFLRTRHRQATVLYLHRVACHLSIVLHIWLRLCGCTLRTHELCHPSRIRCRCHRQHESIFLARWPCRFSSNPHKYFHRSKSDILDRAFNRFGRSTLLRIDFRPTKQSLVSVP